MTANPNFIGYYNHQDMPLSISDHGRPHEIQAGAPVVNQNGTLVTYSPLLEELVQTGLLRKIPKDHPKFKNHDALVEKKSNAVLSNAKADGKKPTGKPAPKGEDEDVVTVISSGKGGGMEQSNLPEGAKWTDERGRSEINYDGKFFPGTSALNAFIASTRAAV